MNSDDVTTVASQIFCMLEANDGHMPLRKLQRAAGISANDFAFTVDRLVSSGQLHRREIRAKTGAPPRYALYLRECAPPADRPTSKMRYSARYMESARKRALALAPKILALLADGETTISHLCRVTREPESVVIEAVKILDAEGAVDFVVTVTMYTIGTRHVSLREDDVLVPFEARPSSLPVVDE